MRKKWLTLMVVLSLNGLVHCGEEGDNGKIDFKITPKSPVVIDADMTIDPGLDTERSVTAPWFLFGFSVVNRSTMAVTIQSMVFNITGVDSSGQVLTGTVSIDPAETPNETYLEEVAAGASVNVPAAFYVHSLPKGAVGFAYTIEAVVQGWFGETDGPIKRLDKRTTFVTK